LDDVTNVFLAANIDEHVFIKTVIGDHALLVQPAVVRILFVGGRLFMFLLFDIPLGTVVTLIDADHMFVLLQRWVIIDFQRTCLHEALYVEMLLLFDWQGEVTS